MNNHLVEVLDDWPLWGLTTTPVTVEHTKKLEGGLTNSCYQLSLSSGEYIIRISADNSDALGIDRNIEKNIHQLVSNLNFTSKLRYCDDENRYWIRDYIAGEVLADQAIADEYWVHSNILVYMVEQLKALHQLRLDIEMPSLTLPKVNISDKAEAYWQLIESKHPNHEILKMKPLLQVAMSEPPSGNFCLCHLDPVLANWLYTDTGLKLLDWEYAGFAHPLWDLAALFQAIKVFFTSEMSAEVKNLEEKIIQLYGVEDLVAWRRANMQMEYLSSLWYQAQEK